MPDDTPPATASWWRDGVIYQIYPARPLGQPAEGETVLGPEEGVVIELDAPHMSTV